MAAKNEYAKALFMLAKEEDKCEAVFLDLGIACDALIENPAYADLLDTPALRKGEKLDLIDKAFSALDKDVLNFVKILCQNRLTRLMPEIRREFEALYDEERGIERVEAITAIPMTEGQLSSMKARLEATCGKTIVIKNTVAPEILGGVKLRYLGKQLDGSVKTRLDKLEAGLKGVIV